MDRLSPLLPFLRIEFAIRWAFAMGAVVCLGAFADSSKASHHWNLALDNWHHQLHGAAVQHLLKGTELSHTPSQISKILEATDNAQRALGLRENATQEWRYLWGAFWGMNAITAGLALLFWFLVAAAFGFGKSRFPAAPTLWMIAALLSSCLTLAGVLGQANLRTYQVVEGPDGSVPLFALSEPKAGEHPLATLPSGTIVRILTKSSERVQIAFPIQGWVPLSALIKEDSASETPSPSHEARR